MRPFLRQPVARALGAILLACALALASGCDGVWGGAALSERDLRERYAMQLLEGAGVGFTVITAERYDPATGMLHDIRIEDGERMIHADRAELIISVERQTVSLRLHDVVGADHTTGAIISLDDMTTDPAPVRVGAGG